MIAPAAALSERAHWRTCGGVLPDRLLATHCLMTSSRYTKYSLASNSWLYFMHSGLVRMGSPVIKNNGVFL